MLFMVVLTPALTVVGKETPKRGGLSITSIYVDRVDSVITLGFHCEPDRLAISKKERMTVVPVISDGVNRVELEPFVVLGKKAKMSFARSADRDMISVPYNRALDYETYTGYEDWMEGATLSFESNSRVCAKRSLPESVLVDGKIYTTPPEEIIEEVEIVEYIEVFEEETAGERLEKEFSFLASLDTKADFNPKNRDGAVVILYRVGMSELERNFRNNARNLDVLTSVINEINGSSNSRVAGIMIIGFASPEGNYQYNMKLAERRVGSLKDYLVRSTGVAPEAIETMNGGIDWYGLSLLVENSDMAHKDEVIEIIENIPVWDSKNNIGRRGELMKLRGGDPYRYMYRNFFPELRAGTCLKVYYENIDKQE